MKRQSRIQISHMSIWSSLQFMVSQSCQEVKRRPCGYCVSFLSVLVVVAASAVSQSIIDRAPLIFLKSAEGPAAQSDIYLQSESGYLSDEHPKSPHYLMSKQSLSQRQQGYLVVNFLNYTRIQEVLGETRAKQASPRNMQQLNISSVFQSADCIDAQFLNQLSTRNVFGSPEHIKDIQSAQNLGQVCGSNSREAIFVAIDTVKEEYIRLGWEYPFPELLAHEVVISSKLADFLNVKVGDNIMLYGEFYDFYGSYFIDYYFNQCNRKYNVTNYNATYLDTKFSYIKAASQRHFPYVVKGILESTYGKFPDGDSDKLILVEQKWLFNNLAYWSWIDPFLEQMYIADPSQYADQIRINLPDRFDIYMSSNYEDIQSVITSYASNINKDLGVYPVDMNLPVLEELYNSRFGQLFLGIILNMIIVILFLLSVILLYTLLLISVETKTYDLGVLRVLGFNKLGVVMLVITQAMSYVLPAICAGILLSIPLLVYAGNALKASIGVDLSPEPTTNAVFLSLGLGLIIPLLSSIVPIKEALKQQLSFALDLQRSKSQAVKIEVDMEGKGLPWGRIQIGLIGSIFGICIYYFLPLALLSFNIGLLLAIFFFILCGMLLGLVIFAFNIQYLMEKLVVFVLLFWIGSAKRVMVLKNLASHRIKNRRTALMYSLSIAFVIFIFVGMSVQIANQSTQTIQKHGCYMEITKSSGYLPVMPFEQIIADINKAGDMISNFAWITAPLDTYMKSHGYQSVFMTHIGQVYQFTPKVYGVSPSLFSLGFNQFLNIEDQEDSTGLDPVEELYTARGSQSAIVGTSYATQLNIQVDQDSSFLLVVYNNTFSKYHEIRASAILTGAPAMKFSSLPSVKEQDVIVSLPNYRRLAENIIPSVDKYPMQRLLLRFGPDADLDHIYLKFNSYIQTKGVGAKIWDFRDYETSVEQSQQLITLIFNALTIVVMFLCFFSLMTSMSANMLEQVKEIAVLRAIGNTNLSIYLVYTFESFVLVLSSSLIGLIVGFIIGQSMALQQTLFTQLPLIFVFPWQMLLVIVGISILASIVSVIIPSRTILKNEIAQIMRMA